MGPVDARLGNCGRDSCIFDAFARISLSEGPVEALLVAFGRASAIRVASSLTCFKTVCLVGDLDRCFDNGVDVPENEEAFSPSLGDSRASCVGKCIFGFVRVGEFGATVDPIVIGCGRVDRVCRRGDVVGDEFDSTAGVDELLSALLRGDSGRD